MPKIEVVNTETGEHLLVEKVQYYRQLRRRGIFALAEEFCPTHEVEVEVPEVEVVEVKRGRGRPKLSAALASDTKDS